MSVRFNDNNELVQHYQQLSNDVQQGRWINTDVQSCQKFGFLWRFIACLKDFFSGSDSYASVRIDKVSQKILNDFVAHANIIDGDGIDAMCHLLDDLDHRSKNYHEILDSNKRILLLFKDRAHGNSNNTDPTNKDDSLPTITTVAYRRPVPPPPVTTTPPPPPTQPANAPLPPPPPKFKGVPKSSDDVKKRIKQAKQNNAQANQNQPDKKEGSESYKIPETPTDSGVKPHEFLKTMAINFKYAKSYLYEKDASGRYTTVLKSDQDKQAGLQDIRDQYGVSKEKVLLVTELYLDFTTWSEANKIILLQRQQWQNANVDADMKDCPIKFLDKKSCFADVDSYLARLDSSLDQERCKAIYYQFMGFNQDKIAEKLDLQLSKDDLKDKLVDLLS